MQSSSTRGCGWRIWNEGDGGNQRGQGARGKARRASQGAGGGGMKHPAWWKEKLITEVNNGCTQKRAALLYAMLMMRSSLDHSWDGWLAVNACILNRWPIGLVRVKEMAWALYGCPVPEDLLAEESAEDVVGE